VEPALISRVVRLTLIALAALTLGPARVAIAQVHGAHGASGRPTIVIRSPQSTIYRSGSTLLVKFSCTSPSGIARCTATLGGAGARARRVTSGDRIMPAKTGSYTLRITAMDRHRRLATTTLRFLVERAISWSGYTWYVRHPGWGGPGPNHWSDSTGSVRVSGSDLAPAS
jgi:hypothetical protein